MKLLLQQKFVLLLSVEIHSDDISGVPNELQWWLHLGPSHLATGMIEKEPRTVAPDVL